MTDRPEPPPDASTSLHPVGTHIGAYRLIRELGRGGMGVVYEAESERDGRRVALKLLADGLRDDEARARFLREGRLAAGVMHPNAVYVYDTAEVDGTPIIIMELVPGGTLDELVARNGPPPIADVLTYAHQLVDGLEAAAAAGVLHRDVKPSNCFVVAPGQVKIGDFGLSKPSGHTKDLRLTQSGLLMGTPAYAAPEQLLGEPLDVRADIYALGATLWFLLTGRTPFGGAHAAQLMAAVLQGTLPSLSALRPDVPPALEAVLVRCLARQPTARFANWAEVREALQALQEADAEPARPAARLWSALVDAIVLTLPGELLESVAGRELPDSLEFAATATLFMLGKALPEHRSGRSLGKAVFGLRLLGPHSRPPSVARSIVRALLWTLLYGWPELLGMVLGRDLKELNEVIFLSLLLPLLLMLPMRLGNGYASVLDSVLGTRVLRSSGRARVFRFVSAALPPLTAAGGNEMVVGGTLGQYRLSGRLFDRPDGSQVFLAHDEALARAVWVHQVKPGTPAVTGERRTLVRAARLRWLAGHRALDGGGWDAYGAPEGQALLSLTEPVSWSRCAGWLADVANEVAVARAAGEAVPSVRAGDLWIAAGEQALVLDFAEATGEGNGPTPPVGAALQQIARRALLGPAWTSAARWPLLPLSVRSFLDGLGERDDADGLGGSLTALSERGEAVTPRQLTRARLPLGLGYGAVAVVLLGMVAGAMRLTEEQRQLGPFVEFLVNAEDGPVEAPERGADTLEMGRMRAVVSYKRRDSLPAQRMAVEQWMRVRHTSVLRDSARRNEIASAVSFADSSEISRRRLLLERLAAQSDSIPAADAQRAIGLVEREWSGRPPGTSHWDTEPWPTIGGATGTFLVVLLLGGLLSIATSAIAGRGPLLRAAALQVVGADGREAHRRKLLLRTTVNWAPILCFPPLSVILLLLDELALPKAIPEYAPQDRATVFFISVAISFLAGLLLLVRIWSHARRTPGDVVAKTWIVPE